MLPLLLVAVLQDPAALLERVVSLDPAERTSARLELAKLPKEALKDHPAALALLGDPPKDFAKLLGSADFGVLRVAAEAANPDVHGKELAKLMDHEDLAVAMAAARSLGRAKAAPVQRALLEVATTPDEPRRKVLACYGIESASGTGEQLPSIVSQAESEKAPVREAAWAAIANLPRAAAFLRRRADPKDGDPAAPMRKLFESEAVPDVLRTLSAGVLLRTGTLSYAEVCEWTTHEKLGDWARRAVLDAAIHRRCVLLPILIRKLGEHEKAEDETKEPIPTLELLLAGQGAQAAGTALKDRIASYRAWWERNRTSILDRDVVTAIDQGVQWLRGAQEKDGSWAYCLCGTHRNEAHAPGTTALALYTLLKCGVPLKDRQVAAGFEQLLTVPLDKVGGAATYTISLEAIAFAESVQELAALIKPEKGRKPDKQLLAETLPLLQKHQARLRECAEWLVEAQTKTTRGGYEMGDWGYGKVATTDMDNSNSQFAVLGLRAAANAGIPIPDRAWARSLAHWLNDQTKDGGWPYRKEKDNAAQGGTRSMSAAGLYCTLVSNASLRRKDPVSLLNDAAVKRGFDWHQKHYPVPEPRRDRPSGHVHSVYYDLYSLERAMMVSKTDKLAGRDWYHDGALFILFNQSLAGDWIDATDTCFALLFLKKAYVAVATGEK
jgi:hypothetical protein